MTATTDTKPAPEPVAKTAAGAPSPFEAHYADQRLTAYIQVRRRDHQLLGVADEGVIEARAGHALTTADIDTTLRRARAAEAERDRLREQLQLHIDPDSFKYAGTTTLRALEHLARLASPYLEAYCIRSGRPVRWGAGDRCRDHGHTSKPCEAWLRVPQCTHPLGARNGGNLCDECGRPLTPPADAPQPDAPGSTAATAPSEPSNPSSARQRPAAAVEPVKLRPVDWCIRYNLCVLDSDGWRGKDGKPWAEPITLREFYDRALPSTTNGVATGAFERIRAELVSEERAGA
jgi:hypothetical protein